MAHDDSAASNLEDWIITTIEAQLTTESITGIDVRPFAGVQDHIANRQVQHVLAVAPGDATIQVMHTGEPQQIQEASNTYHATHAFSLIVAVSNTAGDGASARRGTATRPGANKLMEVVRRSLQGAQPTSPMGTPDAYFEQAFVRFTQNGWEEAGFWVTVGEVQIQEVQAP